MKILVVAERLPSQLGGGNSRQYNIIHSLAQQHHYTVATHAFPEDLFFRPQLAALVEQLEIIELQPPVAQDRSRTYWRLNAWRQAFFDPQPQRGRYFQTQALRTAITRLLARTRFDLVQVHQAYLIPLLSGIPIQRGNPPVLLDMQDILSDFEHQIMLTKTKALHRFQAWLEWQKIIRLERSSLKHVNICTAVSEEDRLLWTRIHPASRVEVAPNGVDLDYFNPTMLSEAADKQLDHPTILFCGSLNYGPNADAVRWFYQDILPTITAAQPGVSWQVVGWGPPGDIKALHHPPAIEVTGFVEDIRPFLQGCSVVVVPLLAGSGTRLKILEAWAMGKAVVSTQLGAQGLLAQHNHNILLADDAQTLAEHTTRLLKDPAERSRLGKAGRQTVEEYYSWEKTAQIFDSIYHSLID